MILIYDTLRTQYLHSNTIVIAGDLGGITLQDIWDLPVKNNLRNFYYFCAKDLGEFTTLFKANFSNFSNLEISFLFTE